MGYCRPILAGHDDSSVVIACHQGALPLLKEDEAKGSAEQICQAIYSLLQLNFVTAHRRMRSPILDECDGITVASPSSLHIVENHQH